MFDLICKLATPRQWAEWLSVPIEHAVEWGNLEVVNDLLVAGATSKELWDDCLSRDGRLLCLAVKGRNDEMVSALLKAGANVNVLCRKKQWSALHQAASNGQET